jgi:hypothetical protein
MSATVSLWRVGVLGVVGVIVLCVCGVPVVGAAERKPFGITKLALQTIKETEEVTEKPGSETIRRFVNKPYAFTQAGGHPWALATTIEFTSEKQTVEGGIFDVPTQNVKDVVTDLPPGLLGDPLAVPRCPLTQVLSKSKPCPASTQVGVASTFLGDSENISPIVNLTPEAGQSAEFGVETTSGITFVLTAHLVRTAQGYGITVVSNNIAMASELRSAELTFWGVPADPSHDVLRGLSCGRIPKGIQTCFGRHGGEPAGIAPVPFLTMPTNCAAGPETVSVHGDSWQEPGIYTDKVATMPGVTGCGLVQFIAGTEIKVRPDTSLADEPAGLGVSLAIPQVETPGTLATPQLRETKVTLPEGMSVSSGIVDGIRACEATGPEGIDIPTGLNANGEPLRPGELGEGEERGLNGEPQLAPGHCPNASTVGTAEAITPLLPVPVKGHIYLARPGCGGTGQAPCTLQDALDGNLYKLYLELGGTGEFANTGIQFKVPFDVQANPATGQLTTVVQNIAQAPVSEVKVNLNGGPRASLDTPPVCGPAVTTADFTPWSAPGTTPEGLIVAGTPDATVSSSFNVEGCANPPPFNPGFLAGTVTPQAGQFTQFTMNLARHDREQYVKGIQVHTPPGLLGMLSNVTLCSEPAANQGTCPETSKIGTTRVATGAGSHPFEIEGNVYLTGPYRGAPFGLSIVTHVVAGPFNLGLVIVRARIIVDPENSTLTITTDETGPYAVPQIVFGVPVRLKRVTVNIDRPNFMFNPTNCTGQQITAAISGSQNTVANVSSPFAVGGCKSLAFKPKFIVTTSGHTSRSKGASLDAKLSYPKDALGNDANIAHVKVSLPKQLPSRLTTLQKACLAATFNTNPANCPKASIVGIARAHSPLLPVGLSGPVYFVSHGGEAFPSLIVVLQGDNVRVDLTGSTFINKTGITSSTFNTIPDVPVNTFELYLPQGPFSALAANGNLCKTQTKLVMPTTFTAQNGAQLKQNTKITVTGCNTNTTQNTQGHNTKNARGHSTRHHTNSPANRTR